MSLVLVVSCDGTPADRPSIVLGQCRASFPTQQSLRRVAVAAAVAKGWSVDGWRHLCPSCTGARAKRSVFK